MDDPHCGYLLARPATSSYHPQNKNHLSYLETNKFPDAIGNLSKFVAMIYLNQINHTEALLMLKNALRKIVGFGLSLCIAGTLVLSLPVTSLSYYNEITQIARHPRIYYE